MITLWKALILSNKKISSLQNPYFLKAVKTNFLTFKTTPIKNSILTLKFLQRGTSQK